MQIGVNHGFEYVIEQLICSLHSVVQVQLFPLKLGHYFYLLVSFKTGGITGYVSICDAKFVCVHIYIYMHCIYNVPVYADTKCCSLLHL